MNGTSNSLIQAVRGPVMLIALGALVEFDYMGVYGFSRTWPILIILFGILKLLEKIARPDQPFPTNRPSAGGSVI